MKPTPEGSGFSIKMGQIKVVLSCPQVILREGIHFVISGEEDLEVAGEATDNLAAFELIEAEPPDVAILSLNDDKIGGAEITRRIKRMYPSTAVVLLTDTDDSEQFFASLASGISAYITQDIDPESLVAVIKEAAGGGLPVVVTLLTPVLAARTLADFQDLATLNERLGVAVAQLSNKEVALLDCIVASDGIEQVKAKLNLNEDVIRNSLRIILHKLVVNEQARAVIMETQRGLPSFVPGVLEGRTSEYLTRAEFNDFKDNLMARFKSLVGEKS